MQGIRDLLSSERGALGLVIVALATALLAFGKLTNVQWVGVVTLIATALITSKTITTNAEARAAVGGSQ